MAEPPPSALTLGVLCSAALGGGGFGQNGPKGFPRSNGKHPSGALMSHSDEVGLVCLVVMLSSLWLLGTLLT